MVENLKTAVGSPAFGNTLAGMGFLLVFVGFATGFISIGHDNAKDLNQLKQQYTELQQQEAEAQRQAGGNYEKLSAKLDTRLGPDALNDTVRRLSEISGQLSALDERQRKDEDSYRAAIVRMQTQLETITAASQAQLPRR